MKLLKLALLISSCTVLTACSTTSPASVSNNKEATSQTANTTGANTNEVEITLKNRLDGTTSSYCLDIMGGGNNVKVEEDLQAHTCYSYKGSLGEDQIFDSSRFTNKQFYMPKFDVCMIANNVQVGQKLDLASCDNSTAQQFEFTRDGTIRPVSNTQLCVTASGETTYGRSKKHQKKELTLETCTDSMATKQQWHSRSLADD